MISIELYGNPIPQKRTRFARRGKIICGIDDQKHLKEGYRWQIKSQYKEEALKVPVALDIIFYMPIPKSLSGIKKRQMANGIIAHSKKPDLDNLEKFLIDCLNKIVFHDDCQIIEMRTKKIYSTKPGTTVRIIPLADEKRELLYENCTR
ncbi:MAG: RusA family crossover junction endodeoxyribonuclease [Bacteroidales bacterium]